MSELNTGTAKRETHLFQGREYCKHDSIPRKCQMCDLEEEVEKYKKALEETFKIVRQVRDQERTTMALFSVEEIIQEALKRFV